MAIYHLNVKIITRAKGQSALASAAYRHACVLHDERLNKVFDYSHKQHVIHSELLIPADAPAWVLSLAEQAKVDIDATAGLLWNRVEASEKRKDSQLSREIEFALPVELTSEQNIILAREFLQDQFAACGMLVDFSVHDDKGKPHVHAMLTMRSLNQDGFSLKVRDWNAKMLHLEWREKWAEYANFHLKLHRHDVRIDHRSYKDQGIELLPLPNQSLAVLQMERRGLSTERVKEVNQVRQHNLALIAENPQVLLTKLEKESTTFTAQKLGQELGRYVNDQGKFSLQQQALLGEFSLTDVDPLNPAGAAGSVLTEEMVAKIIQSIEQHESVFKESDIAKAVAPYTQHADAFAQALMQVKASTELMSLGAGDDGRDRFTTRTMFALENELQHIADSLKNQAHFKITPRRRDGILEIYQTQIGKQLTPEQLDAVKYILEPRAIRCLVGRAGTGKSFSLGAAKAVWEQQGLRVQGIALSGIAADGLAKDAGINSRTIESFRYALADGRLSLDRHDVVVMDEAGMADSVSMLAVLKAIEAAQAKLVLVGDSAQLQPVGPGASFRALIERLKFKEIQTVYRQDETWQREATVAFSSGRVSDGLAAYEAKGCIHHEKTILQAQSRLMEDWFAARASTHKALSEFLVIAHRNDDVNQLNQLLREQRVVRGEIAEGYQVNTRCGEINIAHDDRILFLKNDRGLGVSNGRFATIQLVEFTESGKVLAFTALLDGTNQTVKINPSQYSDFTHGYAATVHKVQGMTVDHSFVYAGGSSWNRHLTYVALSRHRQSAHLYANQETHANFKTLQHHLGRVGIKDSLLDFPLAFAERRGIDTAGLLKRLPQHLAKRLSTLKETLVNQIGQWVDPAGFAKRYENKRRQQLEMNAIVLRREEARLVAAYVDVNCEVGKCWQTLNTKLHELGLDKLTYEAKAFALISGTQEYSALQQAMHKRNATAFQITQALPRYERAIEIHSLDVNKLQQQADRHACFLRVEDYLHQHNRGASVLRDRLAADIMPEIKAHYARLKAVGVSAQEVKQQSTLHLRRQRFCNLTAEERAAFKTVEHYQQLNRQLGERWSAHGQAKKVGKAEKAKTLIKRAEVSVLDQLTAARDQLAHQITTNRQGYDQALDFYQIGIAAPFHGEKPTEKDMKQAESRWYKLQQHAAGYELQQRVKAYHQALFVGDSSTRMQLANAIVQETKAHHGAVVGLRANTSEVWRAIRRDAKQYERHEFYRTLGAADCHRFTEVEAYVEAKQAHSSAWREIFAAKSTADRDDKNLFAKLAPYATRYTQTRDALADQVIGDMTNYAKVLTYFNVTPEALQPQAYQHRCRINVEHYQQASNPLIKGQQALAIIADPKAHHGALIEQGIVWKDVYRSAKLAERQALFATLTAEDKKVHRLVDRYREANQAAGKLWSELKPAATHQSLSPAQNTKVELALAKRDYSAWRLVNSARALHPDSFTQWATAHRLKPERLLQQQAKQVTRITAVQQWQSTYRDAVRAAQTVYAHFDTAEKTITKNLQKSFTAIEKNLQVQQHYRLDQKAFHYTLQAQGFSREQFNQTTREMISIKAQLQSLVKLKNLDQHKVIEVAKTQKVLPNLTTDKQRNLKAHYDLTAPAKEVTQQAASPVSYTPQQLEHFKQILNKYHSLEQAHNQHPAGERELLLMSYRVSQVATVMSYIQASSAQTAANIQVLSQQYVKELQQDCQLGITFEGEKLYQKLLKKYKQLTASEHDPKQQEVLSSFSYRLAQLPHAMTYFERYYSNIAQDVKARAQSHQTQQERQLGITPEDERRYQKFIQKYKELRTACEKDSSRYSKQHEVLGTFSQRLAELPRAMAYLERNYPKLAKDVRSRAQSHKLQQEIEIER